MNYWMRIALLVCLLVALPSFAGGKVRVKAHQTKSGSYVPAHYRTSADSRTSNNWSSTGNVNPYTGKKGSKKP